MDQEGGSEALTLKLAIAGVPWGLTPRNQVIGRGCSLLSGRPVEVASSTGLEGWPLRLELC